MSKKHIYLAVLGIFIFLVSIATINLISFLPVRALCAIGCLAGTIIAFASINWYDHPVFRLRLIWYALFFLIIPPTLTILLRLIIIQTLPKHIYYISGANSIIVLSIVVCLFLGKEIALLVDRARKNKS